MNSIPNLFIIGAMKSGTTSLHHYMSKHPELFMCEPKEPGFYNQKNPSKEFSDWYYQLFAGATTAHKYCGDGSTCYAKIPEFEGTAERIKAVSPNAKIIYVMRDPFKRMISHYWHTVRPQQTDGQTKDLYTAVKTHEEYLAFSDYPRQIAPYIKLFGRENIHFILFEEMTKNPKEALMELFTWLKLPYENFDWSILDEKLNSRPEKVMGATGLGIMHKLSYTKAWSFLSKLFPKSLKRWLYGMAVKEIDPNTQKQNEERLRNEYKEYFESIKLGSLNMSGIQSITNHWKI
jgi:Sulfotransferase domain